LTSFFLTMGTSNSALRRLRRAEKALADAIEHFLVLRTGRGVAPGAEGGDPQLRLPSFGG